MTVVEQDVGAATTDAMTSKVRQALEAAGFKIEVAGVVDLPHNVIVAYRDEQSSLDRALGKVRITVEVPDDYAPDAYVCDLAEQMIEQLYAHADRNPQPDAEGLCGQPLFVAGFSVDLANDDEEAAITFAGIGLATRHVLDAFRRVSEFGSMPQPYKSLELLQEAV